MKQPFLIQIGTKGGSSMKTKSDSFGGKLEAPSSVVIASSHKGTETPLGKPNL